MLSKKKTQTFKNYFTQLRGVNAAISAVVCVYLIVGHLREGNGESAIQCDMPKLWPRREDPSIYRATSPSSG
jgi:hypothetical protein